MKPNSLKLFRGVVSAGSLFLLAGSLIAANVILDSPMADTRPDAVYEASTNSDMAVFQPMGDRRDRSLPQPFKAGPVTFRPHISYAFSYGTGLETSPSNTVDSIIHTISPGLAIDLGRHWTLDYTPTIRLYSNRAFRNAVNHTASLTGGLKYEDWVFGLSQTFDSSDELRVETATQTKQDSYNTSLTASHQLSEKFSFDLALSQMISDIDQENGVGTNILVNQQSTRNWMVNGWLNYQAAKRLYLGIGGGIGYANVDADGGQPDQLFETLSARIQWRVTDKLGFTVSGGFDQRQTLAEGFGDALNPVFDASLQYTPFKHTQITLSGSRHVSATDYLYTGTSTEVTTARLDITQRLLQKFYLSGGVTYSHTDYTTTFGPLSTLREDDNYSIYARLSRTVFKRGNVALTYSYGDNQSMQRDFTGVTRHDYSYRSSQVGFEAGFAY
jgi:hypothetical protein